VNDYLYSLALDALNAARKAKQVDEQDYRYLMHSLKTARCEETLEALCLDLINQFRPVAWNATDKQKRKFI
jgi:hypothetical protein